MEFGVQRFRVMTSWVNNENNNQSQYWNMSNTYMTNSLYTRQRTQLEVGGNRDAKGVMCTWIVSTGMQGQRITGMCELYYKRETELGNNKFHDLECLDVGDMTGATGVTRSGPNCIWVQAWNRISGNLRRCGEVTVVGAVTWNITGNRARKW